MDATKLSDLPLIFQVIAGAGLFFGTAMIAIGGWVYPKLKARIPSAFTPATPANQAVVLSAAIADSQAIKELAHSIDRLCVFLKEDAEDDARRTDRVDERMHDVLDEIRMIKSILRERTLL